MSEFDSFAASGVQHLLCDDTGWGDECMTKGHDYRTRRIIIEQTTGPLYPTVLPCYSAWKV